MGKFAALLVAYFIGTLLGGGLMMQFGLSPLWGSAVAVAVTVATLVVQVVLEAKKMTQPLRRGPVNINIEEPTAPLIIEYGKPYTYRVGSPGSSFDYEITVHPAIQCPDDAPMDACLRCQGPYGHGGPHWVYNGNGNLIRWDAEGMSDTAPGNALYVHPKDFVRLRHTAYYKRECSTSAQKDDHGKT